MKKGKLNNKDILLIQKKATRGKKEAQNRWYM